MTHLYAHGFAALAHRGGLPSHENSLTAFQHAHDLGFRYFETDVHATKDGVLVAFHDDRLDRVTDQTGLIRELPWAKVSQALIGGSDPIPRFDELLEAFPEATFNVDIKASRAIGPLAGICERSTSFRNRICATSFSAIRLHDFRRATFGQVATSTSWPGIFTNRFIVPTPGPAIAFQVPVDFHGLPVVTESFVARAHRLGRVVHVWTINDAAEMERLIDLGVDGIVTDEPARLKEILVQRGLWS